MSYLDSATEELLETIHEKLRALVMQPNPVSKVMAQTIALQGLLDAWIELAKSYKQPGGEHYWDRDLSSTSAAQIKESKHYVSILYRIYGPQQG